MTTRKVALAALAVAPENARFGNKPTHIEELAANIWRYGVLQPLVAYDGPNGVWYVVDGARRLAALEKLHAEGKTPAGIGAAAWDAIEILVSQQEDALAHSLAANTQRVNLGMVEEAEQFSRMTTAGTTVEEIARVFGCKERHVQQRLKLASLHEPILRALEKGDINLDVAQAYAGATMERQAKVWKKLTAKGRVHQVKDALRANTLHAGDPLARFVGEDAYRAAGGTIEAELFLTPDMSRWLDVPLAEKLADEKLRALAEELKAEGFAFVEAAPEIGLGQFVEGARGKPRPPNAEEKKALKALEKQSDAARKAQAARRKELNDDDKLWDEDFDLDEDEVFAAANATLEAAIAEHKRIERSLIAFDEKAKEKTGIVVTIDADGRPNIRRGMVKPKSSAPPKPKHATKNGSGASVTPARREPEGPAPAMTNGAHERSSKIASAVVGRAIAANTNVAIIALTAFLARTVLLRRDEDDRFADLIEEEVINLQQPNAWRDGNYGVERGPLDSDAANAKAREEWIEKVKPRKGAASLEVALSLWPFDQVLALAAFCTGELVRCVETHAADKDRDPLEARFTLAALGKLAGADPAAHFVPDAVFLGGLSRDSLAEAAKEVGIEAGANPKKGALAAQIADNAAAKRWTPPLIRTLCGVAAAPKAKTKQTRLPVQTLDSAAPAKTAGKGAAKPAAARKAAPTKSAAPKKVKKLAKPAPKKVVAKKAAKSAATAEARA